MRAFDEMYASVPYADEQVREHYRRYADWLQGQSVESWARRRVLAELIFRKVGFTFAVYG